MSGGVPHNSTAPLSGWVCRIVNLPSQKGFRSWYHHASFSIYLRENLQSFKSSELLSSKYIANLIDRTLRSRQRKARRQMTPPFEAPTAYITGDINGICIFVTKNIAFKSRFIKFKINYN